MIKQTLKELDQLYKARIRTLVQEKKAGTPLVEYNGNFISDELIRAAGANSFLMCRGGEPEPTEACLDYMLRFMNPYARTMAGMVELGIDPITPHADALVLQQTDCHVNRISELIEFKGYNIIKVGVPADWTKEVAYEYYIDSTRKMLAKIEELTGKPVDMEKAKEFFAKSNKINDCLAKLNELRKKDNPPIGFDEMIRLHHFSFFIDADIIIEKLEALYENLKDAPGKFPEGAPRILVAGRVFAMGDYTVPRLIEQSGGVIVAEMMDEGVRLVENNVELEGDLVRNFAKSRYRDALPINLFQPAWQQRLDKLKALVNEYKVDGILWYQLSFDEIYDMEYTCLAKWMNEAGIPIMKLESSYEYSRESMGPLTTRIESFVESLKEGK